MEMNKAKRRLRQVQVREVSIVTKGANNRPFALLKSRDGKTMQEFYTQGRDVADMDEHEAAVVEATFDAQEKSVQEEILKRLTALNLKCDLVNALQYVQGAFADLYKNSPWDYFNCTRHPDQYDVIKSADGMGLAVVPKLSLGTVSADGQREHVIGADGRGIWRPIKKVK